MKKFLCFLAALMLLSMSALAQENAFVSGSQSAALGGDMFFVVREAEGDALVRFAGGQTAFLSERAEAVTSLVEFENALYYLRRLGSGWELVSRDAALNVRTAYAFEAGSDVRRLSVYGENLMVLIDGNLHMVYPGKGLCIKLAGAAMSEYVIADDYAYFVSQTDVIDYRLYHPDGSATKSAGCLYRLNLSTGNTSLVLKSGVEDLSISGSKLYFHNLADGYVSLAGDSAEVRGKLYSFDIASDVLTREWDGYDWGYVAADGGPVLRDQEGLKRTDGSVLQALPESCEMAAMGSGAALLDPANLTISFIDLTAE